MRGQLALTSKHIPYYTFLEIMVFARKSQHIFTVSVYAFLNWFGPNKADMELDCLTL